MKSDYMIVLPDGKMITVKGAGPYFLIWQFSLGTREVLADSMFDKTGITSPLPADWGVSGGWKRKKTAMRHAHDYRQRSVLDLTPVFQKVHVVEGWLEPEDNKPEPTPLPSRPQELVTA